MPPSRSQQHRRARPLETSNNTGIIVLIPPIKQTEALARHLAAAAAALPGTAPTPRETKARPAAAIWGIDQSSRLSFAHALCGEKTTPLRGDSLLRGRSVCLLFFSFSTFCFCGNEATFHVPFMKLACLIGTTYLCTLGSLGLLFERKYPEKRTLSLCSMLGFVAASCISFV